MASVELKIILACLLVVGGIYGKSRWDDRAKLKAVHTELTATQDLAAETDQATAKKLRNDARIDAGVGRVLTKSRELERHDPTYRNYLDRPLPDSTLRLYHDAAAEVQSAGADGADSGADQGHR